MQLHLTPTRNNHVLDLVITNVPNQVCNISILTLAQSGLVTDHAVVTFDFQMAIKAPRRIKQTVFYYGRGDFDKLHSTLEQADLCNTNDLADNVSSNWLKWKNKFLAAVHQAIPIIRNVNSPPWITREIIHAIKKKETVRRKLKSFFNNVLMNKIYETRLNSWSMKAEFTSFKTLTMISAIILKDFCPFSN